MAYDHQVHPNNQQFWQNLPSNRQNMLGKHPVMTMYGDQLSKESYAYSKGKAERAEGNVPGFMGYAQQVERLESRYKTQLAQIAKEITHEIWGIPVNQLNGEITKSLDTGAHDDQDEDNSPAYSQEHDQDLKPEIDKRITMNALTHGSAVHAMMSAYHMAREKIAALDPNLVALYDKVTATSHQVYWAMDVGSWLGQLKNSAAGSVRVQKDESHPEAPPKIMAKGVIFPVLLQELNKGAAELVSMHGVSHLTPEQQKHVFQKADHIHLEPYLIQVGPQLWRKVLPYKPRAMTMGQFYLKLNKMSSADLHKFASYVMEDDPRAKAYFEQPEEEAPGYEEDYDQDDNYPQRHSSLVARLGRVANFLHEKYPRLAQKIVRITNLLNRE